MDEPITGTNETQDNQAPVDPWIAAFAALEPKGEEAPAAAAGAADAADGGTVDAGGQGAHQDEGGDNPANEDAVGGLGAPAGGDAGQDGNGGGSAFSPHFGVTDESIEQYRTQLQDSVRNQAVNDMAREFIKRGVRNNKGALGASIDDADVCKRDSDGVPHFYNPETGQEFRGENPRRQAQEWVDDYNKELARVFNNACAEYEKHLMKDREPSIKVMEFAPKYEKLDPIRQGMLDNVIEDYEIKDKDGNVIGYDCDLDKALAMVERQVSMIQEYAKRQQQQKPPEQPSGPALDMKTSSGAIPSGEHMPQSLAEAMEMLQDKKLASRK